MTRLSVENLEPILGDLASEIRVLGDKLSSPKEQGSEVFSRDRFGSRRRTMRKEFLADLRTKRGVVCDCGRSDRHSKVAFVDKDGKVVEERCPYSWWLSLMHLEYEKNLREKSGLVSKFLEELPFRLFYAAWRYNE